VHSACEFDSAESRTPADSLEFARRADHLVSPRAAHTIELCIEHHAALTRTTPKALINVAALRRRCP